MNEDLSLSLLLYDVSGLQLQNSLGFNTYKPLSVAPTCT